MATPFSVFDSLETNYEEISCPMRKIRKSVENPNLLNAARPVPSESNDGATFPCGFLGLLPKELFCILLKYLDVQAIGKLSLTSIKVRDMVLDWIFSRFLKDKLLMTIDYSRIFNVPRVELKGVSIMFKRATFLFPTMKRIHYLEHFVKNIETLTQPKTPVPANYVLKMRGVILQHYVFGWENSECVKVYDVLNLHYDFRGKMRMFLAAWDPSSSDARIQVKLQVVLRNLFLDWCPCKHIRGFWLDLIIKGYSLKQKAAILVLLYGPLDSSGNINWSWLKDTNSERYERHFSGLAKAISYMYTANSAWHMSRRVQLLFDIIGYPDMWPARSVAALLLQVHGLDTVLVKKFLLAVVEQPSQQFASELWAEMLLIGDRMFTEPESPHQGARIFKSILRDVCASFDQERRNLFLQKLWTDIQTYLEHRLAVVMEGMFNQFEVEELQGFRDLLNGCKQFSVGVMNLWV